MGVRLYQGGFIGRRLSFDDDRYSRNPMFPRRGASWTPAALPGLALWLTAGPSYCYTDGAADFAASSQSLSVASNASLQTGDVDWWMTAWVKFNSAPTTNELISKFRADLNNYEYELRVVASGPFQVININNDVAVSSVTPVAGTWYFVLAWYDSVAKKLWIQADTESPVSTTVAVSPVTNTGAFSLGARSDGTVSLDGRLDSVAFGKSPPGGIASVISTLASRLYNAGAGLVYADLTAAEKTAWGLVSWYDFNNDVTLDAHGTNTLTNNNGVSIVAGITRGQAGDGDAVSVWLDRSGNGNDLTQETLSSRPILYALGGGLWCVTGDGVDDYLQSAGFALDQPCTLAAAFAHRSVSGAYAWDAQSAAAGRAGLDAGSATGWRLAAGSNFDSTVTDISAMNAAVAVYNGASSALYWNGAKTTGDVGATNAQGVTLFSDQAGAGSADADVSEFVASAGAVSDADAALLRTYLQRYGTP